MSDQENYKRLKREGETPIVTNLGDKFRSVVVPAGFDVKCDEENNSPEDIEAGRVNIDIELTFKRVPVVRGGDA